MNKKGKIKKIFLAQKIKGLFDRAGDDFMRESWSWTRERKNESNNQRCADFQNRLLRHLFDFGSLLGSLTLGR